MARLDVIKLLDRDRGVVLSHSNNNKIDRRFKKLKYFFVIVIISGIIFRFNNLAQKPYWTDEIYTLLRASGYSSQLVKEQLYNNTVITAKDILKFQTISPAQNAKGTMEGLAKEEPQHPPLYFLLTRFWQQIFGSSKTATRSLPVICSLLGFPAIYWLCIELFATPSLAWLTMAFYAVSPICLRYAQEVRQYSLWLVLITLASAALLKAIRQPNKLNWSIYSTLVTASLYCQPITILTMIAHGIYFLAREKLRFGKNFISYLIASAIAIGLFSPWLLIMLSNLKTVKETTSWMSNSLPFLTLLKCWSISLDRSLIALHFNYNWLLFWLAIPIVILISSAFYFFYTHSSRASYLFVSSIMGITFLPFLFYDLLAGGGRSFNERFFLPCYLTIYLVLSYFLFSKIITSQQSWLWQLITAITLSISVFICGLSSVSNTWWGWSEHDVTFSQIVRQAENPLVISDTNIYGIVPFIHEIDPETNLILSDQLSNLNIPKQYKNIFLYNPSSSLLSVAEAQDLTVTNKYTFEDPLTSFQMVLYEIKN